MKKFRKKLEAQKKILSQRLKKKTDGVPRHPGKSRPSSGFNRKLRQLLLFARADQHMEEVTEALDRIEKGVYGQCVVCGKEIEPNRLEALPTANRCWNCQQDQP